MNPKMRFFMLISILILLVSPILCLNYQTFFFGKTTGTIDEVPLNQTAWTPNGTTICTAPGAQYNYPQQQGICSDGMGGVISVWLDQRNSPDDGIYVQRIDSLGHALWTPNGTAVCTTAGGKAWPSICSDGAGGAIIAWYAGAYYAQRVNATGIPQWTPNGVQIFTAFGLEDPQICSDGAGGAYIIGETFPPTLKDLYAMRVNSTGGVPWTLNGVAISTENSDQGPPQVCTDGVGGVIISWGDFRNGHQEIYAQRINASGVFQWNATGALVCGTTTASSDPEICSDGVGGAIITWNDARNGPFDIYAQRINASGAPQWTLDGVAICSAGDTQAGVQICTDGVEGAIMTWQDSRSVADTDIYAQRVNATGVTQWTPNGVPACTAEDYQTTPKICEDGAGGAMITWNDRRQGIDNKDIYAQRITAAGILQCGPNGTAICTAIDNQEGPQIHYAGSGRGYIVWRDYRDPSSIYADIYGAFDDYVHVSLDSVVNGSPSNTFNQYLLSLIDNNSHQVSSVYVDTQETVTLQYKYEFLGLDPHYINNITLNYAYDTTPTLNIRTYLDIYNFTSGMWFNVVDRTTNGAQNFQYILETGLYHFFNGSTLLVRVQVLDLVASPGFEFWLNRLTFRYTTAIQMEVVEHLENRVNTPPGIPQLSENEDLNVSITARSWVGDSYSTWTNISLYYRINTGSWTPLFSGSLHGLGTANFIIKSSNYSRGDDVFYYIHFLQFDDNSTSIKQYYWTQNGIKSNEAAAQAAAFRKMVYPILYGLTLNYSVWYKAQIEKTLVGEDVNITVYPSIYVAYENISLNFENTSSDLTNFDVSCINETELNHSIAEDTRNISKFDAPLFYFADGIKSPFVLPLNVNYTSPSSNITIPKIAFDTVRSGRNLVFTGDLLTLSYNGLENWPYQDRLVLTFSDGPDKVVRFDAFTGIMVYYRNYNGTVVNASQELVIGLIGNNQSFPINLWVQQREEIAESGEVFLDASLLNILHDPPGDHSYSILKSGTTFRYGISVESGDAIHQFADARFLKGWTGIGIEEDLTVYTSTTHDTEWEWTWTRTLTSSLDSEDPTLMGPGGGDLYYYVGMIVQYFVIVKNFYIVFNTPDPPNNHNDDLLVWSNASHIDYGLGINTSAAVLGAYLDDYNVSYLAEKNLFQDNALTSEEVNKTGYIDTIFWTPGNIIEYSYEMQESQAETFNFGFDLSIDSFFLWDVVKLVDSDVSPFPTLKFGTDGRVGLGFDLSFDTIETTSTTTNNEIMVHFEDDDSGPSGEYDQFLVYLYEDEVFNTYGILFEENLTYTSRPYEFGTRDRRSPTISELVGLDIYGSGVVNLTCKGIDEETGIDKVKFYYDDDPTFGGDSVQLGYQDNSTVLDPTLYQFSWDTNVFHGSYYLFAVTYDSADPIANSKVSDAYLFQIDNIDPTVSQVLAYGPFREAIDLYANVFDDDSGIEYVEYWDGDPIDPGSTLLGTSYDSSSSYHFIWATDPAGANDGFHYIYTCAYDKAGNNLTSSPIEITVDNSDIGDISEPIDWLAIAVIIAGAAVASALVVLGILIRSRPVVPPPKIPPKAPSKTPTHPLKKKSSTHTK